MVKLYTGGGFSEETNCVDITSNVVETVRDLDSSQEEAVQHILLHSIFCAAEGYDYIVSNAKNMHVIVLVVYYMATHYHVKLKEFCVRTELSSYIPIHSLSKALGQPCVSTTINPSYQWQ